MKKALFAIALAAAAVSASALDLAGMQVDKPVNCHLIAFMSEDANACNTKELEWTTTLEFLDKQTPVMISRNERGVLKSIVMTGFNYDRAVRAMRMQHGRPIHNNADEAVWAVGSQSIRVSRYGGIGPLLVYAGKAAEK